MIDSKALGKDEGAPATCMEIDCVDFTGERRCGQPLPCPDPTHAPAAATLKCARGCGATWNADGGPVAIPEKPCSVHTIADLVPIEAADHPQSTKEVASGDGGGDDSGVAGGTGDVVRADGSGRGGFSPSEVAAAPAEPGASATPRLESEEERSARVRKAVFGTVPLPPAQPAARQGFSWASTAAMIANPIPSKQLGKEGVGAAPEDGISAELEALVAAGDAEIVGADEEGTPFYRLTAKGLAAAAPSATEKQDSTARAAAVPEAGALRALQEIVTHFDPDRMREIAYAALSSPSGDARPPERKPGFNEAMLPEGWATRELLRRCLTSVPAACSRLRRDIRAAIDASKTPLKPTAPVAPLIPEEPKSPSADAAKAEAEKLKDCHAGPGTTEPACGGCIRCLNGEIERLTAELEAWKLAKGAARMRREITALETEVARLRDRMVAAFGEGTDETHLVEIAHEHERVIVRAEKAEARRDAYRNQAQRLADSEGAAINSEMRARADLLSEKQRADAAEAECARLTKERDEARLGAELQMQDAIKAETRADAAEASAKALREATLAILDAAVERSPPVTATNDIEDPGFDYEGHAICMICGEGAGHDEPVVHGDDQPCGKLAALLAPTNPSAEKLTPDPAPLAGESQCPHGFSAGVECPHCQQNRTAPEPLAGQKEGPPRDVSNGPHTYASNDRAEQSNPNQQEP